MIPGTFSAIVSLSLTSRQTTDVQRRSTYFPKPGPWLYECLSCTPSLLWRPHASSMAHWGEWDRDQSMEGRHSDSDPSVFQMLAGSGIATMCVPKLSDS